MTPKLFERYNESARKTIYFSQRCALARRSRSIEPEHLLLGLLREVPGLIEHYSLRNDADARSIAADLAAELPELQESFDQSRALKLSAESLSVMHHAQKAATQWDHEWIGAEHLLFGLTRYSAGAFRLFRVRLSAKRFLQRHEIYRERLASEMSRLQRPQFNKPFAQTQPN